MKKNGRLLKREDPECFVAAFEWVAALGAEARQRLREGAQRTASAFDMSETAARALDSTLRCAPPRPRTECAIIRFGTSRFAACGVSGGSCAT